MGAYHHIYVDSILHEAEPLMLEGNLHKNEPALLLADCQFTIYPQFSSEENRAVVTLHPKQPYPGPLLLAFPQLRDGEYLFSRFQFHLVLLPDVPVHLRVEEPSLPRQDWIEMDICLHGDRIEVTPAPHTRVLAEKPVGWKEADFLHYLPHENNEQSEWLLKAGAALVYTSEDGSMRVILYDYQSNQFRFFFLTRQEEMHRTIYTNYFERLWELEWEQALNLEQFSLAFPPPTWITFLLK